MDALNQYYLDTLGISVWEPQLTARPAPTEPTEPWAQLQSQVSACTQCALSQSRTQTVFGTGSRFADLLIVGEAPGFNEDQQGEPFVGKAGQLLNAMLQSIELKRDDVYIANILKCRPPENRDPQQSEVEQCTTFLDQQIDLLQPKVILAVGRFAAQYLLSTTASLSTLRAETQRYAKRDIPLVVSYHPAYLLRSPRAKGEAYRDLCTVRQLLSA